MSLKCLSNFWRNLEIALINCEINLILTCSAHCLISEGGRVISFSIQTQNLHFGVSL